MTTMTTMTETTETETPTLTHQQALSIAKLARNFDREGNTAAKNSAELTLKASGLLLDDVLPMSVAQSLQADREGRRMQELKTLLSSNA